mgnify:CR=1 FL=1
MLKLFSEMKTISKEPWWKNPKFKIVEIKKGAYCCRCINCDYKFEVPEDLPEREELFGLDVFVVYCPICGTKLRFSVDETPYYTPT